MQKAMHKKAAGRYQLVTQGVTAASTDEEILAAIEAAGEHRFSWRTYDWPEPGSNNTKAWVIPNDIGYSHGRDSSLLKRLKQMVHEGLLEVEYTRRERAYGFYKALRKQINQMPRFRVVRQ